ncbi:MAG: TRAP transporter permease [Candidatus Methylomirabilales bacterium]
MSEEGTRFRRLEGAVGSGQRLLLSAIPATGGLYLLDIHLLLGVVILREQYLALLLSLTLGAVFLSVPGSRSAPRNVLPWYDLVFSFLGLAVGLYLVVFYPELIYTLGELRPERIMLGALAVLLVVEASRRLLGWVMVALVLLFLFYARYADLIPGPLSAKAVTWERLFTSVYIGNDALLGIPLSVIGTIVLAFILFGRGLLAVGGDRFLVDFSLATMGRFRGGPAKIAVLASSLFGTMSGSAVANVASTGVVTIPLMKNTGYRAHVAGAIEAAASNGGQLMPPIMGAAAFVMAEFLAKPYREIVMAALIPAILYYTALFIQVDLEAAKHGLKGLPRHQLPPLRPLLAGAWVLLIPLAVVVYALFIMNLNPGKAGMAGALSTFALALFRPRGRAVLRRFHILLEETGRVLLEVLVIGAVAGVVIGLIMFSGLGFLFSLAVTQLAGGQLFPVLLLMAAAAIVLGMGMGTVAVYVLLAALMGPALIQLGILPLAAHLFIFYFGMLSLITPPICVASYTAAAIAGAHPMGTGFQAMRLGIVAYIVPFLFVFSPTLLLIGSPGDVLLAVATAFGGTALLGVAFASYLFRKVSWVWRVVLTGAAVGLLIPSGGLVPFSGLMNVVGAAVGTVFLTWEWQQSRRTMATGEASG